MAKRRTPQERAADIEARVRLEKAKLELTRLKIRQSLAGTALSNYRGAARNRTNRDWNAKSLSADSAIIGDSKTLVARSRAQTRDDCYGAAVPRAFVRSVVGRGITCIPATATVVDSPIPSDVRTEFDRRAASLWHDWATRPARCDMERRRTFAFVQRWAVTEMVEAGGALVVISERETPRGPAIALQLVEYEQLDFDRMSVTHPDGTIRDVRGGVEVDDFGAPVAYWIHQQHPYDAGRLFRGRSLYQSSESIRVDAARVCHVYDPERARQTIGVPRKAPAIERLRHLGEYDYAQLVAARAEACIGVAIESDSVGSDVLGMAQSEDDPDRQDAAGNDELAMQPFMVARLNPGEKITPFTPTRPGGQYDAYVVKQLGAVAAGCGISYEQVSRDFTRGTYSSQRQAKLEDRRETGPMQDLLVSQLCVPVYEAVVRMAVLNGQLHAPGYVADPDLWHYADWMPDGDEWIDPRAEAEADKLAIEANLSTKTAVLARRGLSFTEVTRRRAEEIRFEREQGLGTAPNPPSTREPAAKPVRPAPSNPTPEPKPEDVAVPEAVQAT